MEAPGVSCSATVQRLRASVAYAAAPHKLLRLGSSCTCSTSPSLMPAPDRVSLQVKADATPNCANSTKLDFPVVASVARMLQPSKCFVRNMWGLHQRQPRLHLEGLWGMWGLYQRQPRLHANESISRSRSLHNNSHITKGSLSHGAKSYESGLQPRHGIEGQAYS
jgi:hypothetical protein